jgi:hypothetical protein
MSDSKQETSAEKASKAWIFLVAAFAVLLVVGFLAA